MMIMKERKKKMMMMLVMAMVMKMIDDEVKFDGVLLERATYTFQFRAWSAELFYLASYLSGSIPG